MRIKPEETTARWQFSLSDLLLATALVSLYAAALLVPLRGIENSRFWQFGFVGPIIQTGAMIAVFAFMIPSIRRQSLRRVEPVGINMIANIPWKCLMIMATIACSVSLITQPLSPIWRTAVVGGIAPFVVLSIAFILVRRVVVGRQGVVHLFNVIPWTVLEIRRGSNNETAELRAVVRMSDFHCTIPPAAVEPIEALRTAALRTQVPEKSWPEE